MASAAAALMAQEQAFYDAQYTRIRELFEDRINRDRDTLLQELKDARSDPCLPCWYWVEYEAIRAYYSATPWNYIQRARVRIEKVRLLWELWDRDPLWIEQALAPLRALVDATEEDLVEVEEANETDGPPAKKAKANTPEADKAEDVREPDEGPAIESEAAPAATPPLVNDELAASQSQADGVQE